MMVPPIKYGFEPHYQSFKKRDCARAGGQKKPYTKKMYDFP